MTIGLLDPRCNHCRIGSRRRYRPAFASEMVKGLGGPRPVVVYSERRAALFLSTLTESAVPLFSFPDAAFWDDAQDAVVFEVYLGAYRGKVHVPRRVIAALVGFRPTAAQALQQVHLNRPLFERAAELRLSDRRLDDDANIHLTGQDIRRAAAGI